MDEDKVREIARDELFKVFAAAVPSIVDALAPLGVFDTVGDLVGIDVAKLFGTSGD